MVKDCLKRDLRREIEGRENRKTSTGVFVDACSSGGDHTLEKSKL